MYAGAGLLLPYFEDVGFSNHRLHHQLQHQQEELLSRNGLLQDPAACHQALHCHPHITSNMESSSSISDYFLGVEGDLFNAPETILEEEPQLEIDPMEAAISMMSAGKDITSTEAIKVADTSSISEYFLGVGGEVDLFRTSESILEETQLDMESIADAISMIPASQDIATGEVTNFADIVSIDSEQLLNDFFSDCKGNPLENSDSKGVENEQTDAKTQPIPVEGSEIVQKDQTAVEASISKSMSMECLIPDELAKAGATLRPSFLGFQQMDYGDVFRMRRAYSEGDIKTLSCGSASLIGASILQHPMERLLSMDSHRNEERLEKLSRYRMKKSTRNFGRKIKYACRKALADSQPRVRGRFAKTEDPCEIPRSSK